MLNNLTYSFVKIFNFFELSKKFKKFMLVFFTDNGDYNHNELICASNTVLDFSVLWKTVTSEINHRPKYNFNLRIWNWNCETDRGRQREGKASKEDQNVIFVNGGGRRLHHGVDNYEQPFQWGARGGRRRRRLQPRRLDHRAEGGHRKGHRAVDAARRREVQNRLGKWSKC